jgi:O-methyltransferase domain/Dimerisation domain
MAMSDDARVSRQNLLQLITGYWVPHAIGVAARLGIADQLQQGPCTSAELAERLSVDGERLERLLRALATVGVFEQVGARYQLTSLSRWLISDVPASLHARAIMDSEEWHRRAWDQLLHTVTTGEPGFERALGMDVFSFMDRNPEAVVKYQAVMTHNSAVEAAAVVEAYDFGAVNVIVDVGGGRGELLATILRRFPGPRGMLFDLPAVVEQMRVQSGFDEHLRGRCEIVPGSFFTDPMPAGDLYLLKHVLHDWDDERAGQILSRVRSRMKENARVLVMELVVPSEVVPSYATFLDLEMMLLHGGKERTIEQYRTLFEKAGLELTRHVRTKNGLFALVEGAAR